MPVVTRWLDETRTVLYMQIEGEWTIEEWLEGDHQINVLIQDAANPIPVIMEFRTPDNYLPPRILRRMPEFFQTTIARDARVSYVFIVGAHTGLLRSVAGVFRRSYHITRGAFVDSFDEAYCACLRVNAGITG